MSNNSDQGTFAVQLRDDRFTAPEMYGAIRQGAQLDAHAWPDERIAAVMRYAGAELKKVSDAMVFFGIAAQYDLNPMTGEIFAFPTGGKIRVFAGRDGFLKAAHRNPRFQAIQSGVVFQGDEFRIVHTWDPETKKPSVHVEHTQSFDGLGSTPENDKRKIVGAYAIVWVEGYPTVVAREWGYYRHLWSRSFSKAPVWHQDPAGMIQNRVIAACCRRAVPLANLWIQGEEGDFDLTDQMEKELGSTTRSQISALKAEMGLAPDPDHEPVEDQVATIVPDSEEPNVVPDPGQREEDEKEEQRQLLDLALKQYKIPRSAVQAWARFHASVPDDLEAWSLNDLTLCVMTLRQGEGKQFLVDLARSMIVDDDTLPFDEKIKWEADVGRMGVTKRELYALIERLRERRAQ